MSDLLNQVHEIDAKIVKLGEDINTEEKSAQDCEAKAREHRNNRQKYKEEQASLQKVREDLRVKIHIENEATRATKAREEAEKNMIEVSNLKAELEKKLAELEQQKTDTLAE